MQTDKRQELIDIAAQIGLIAEMPYWATEGMADKILPSQDIKTLTVGQLLAMQKETRDRINRLYS